MRFAPRGLSVASSYGPGYVMPSPQQGPIHFGTWPIPGEAGVQALVLTGVIGGDTMEASIDGRVVISMKRPSAAWLALSSRPALIGTHEIGIYAETLDRGKTVRCDVFVDGYSLATHEPWSVTRQRAAAVARADAHAVEHSGIFGTKLLAGKSNAYKLVCGASLVEIIGLSTGAWSSMGAFASGALVTANIGIFMAGRAVASRIRDGGRPQPVVRVAEAAITVACLAAAAGVFAAAYLLSHS
jgi:hypothetical protein